MKAFFALLLIIGQTTGLLSNPEEEARAQDLMREIRCVACENEPISQSTSDIAADMRARVREMVAQGHTDAEIREWFVARYGEFVLFRPDASGLGGLFLWGWPFILLLGGAIVLVAKRRPATKAISPVEIDHENDTVE